MAASSFKIIWRGDRKTLEALGDALEDDAKAPDAVSLVKDDAAADDDKTGWTLEVYYTERPTMEALNARAADIADLDAGALETVPDKDWVAHALEGLGVVRIGRFVLYGRHDADKLPDVAELIPVRIDANQAFGTGHHPTTAGCLTLLDRFAGFAPDSILDLGCGSAVLAIAAAKLWDRNVLASDIDPTSAEIAAENAAFNGVGDKVRTLAAAGFDHEDIAAAAPFDFIFANILSGPLCEFAPEMARHVEKTGRVMIAGLLDKQEPEVTAAYQNAGFRLLNRLDQPVWPVLLFVRV